MPRKGGVPENLTPFKKGNKANPFGRPKKLPELEKLLSEVMGEDGDGQNEAKEILLALIKSAKKGDVRAAELLLDRCYGKSPQTIQNTGAMEVVFKYE